MTIFLNSVGYGLVTGSLLAVCAVGLTLQFGVTNFPNISYCQFMTLGAFLTWELSSHFNFWLAAIVSSLLVGLVSLFVGRMILGPYVRRGGTNLNLVIASLSLAFIFAGVMSAIWSTDIYQYNLPVEHPHQVGPFLFTTTELQIILLAAVLLVGTHLLLAHTLVGKSMRAMSDNKSLASLCGIRVSSVTNTVWFISGILGSFGGISLALSFGVFDIGLGLNFLFVVLASIIVGGIGRPYGTMIGALGLGLVIEISTNFISPAYKLDTAFAALVLVLLVRPQGFSRIVGRL